nr:vitamin B12-dependent ribonucleotide reductase [Dehalococcoides mccartyi]
MVLRDAEVMPPLCPGTSLTSNALRVLEQRYLLRDNLGNITETPADMFRRVARAVAAGELIYNPEADLAAKEEEFFNMMSNLEFLPNSPVLLNAGTRTKQLLSCFVVPITDSVEGVFSAVRDSAIIHKSGGGTGFSFSKLRPASNILGSDSISNGPVPFIDIFSAVTDVIKQGGVRRGCNMGVLRVDHPDILEFIRAKDNPLSLTNFCLAVAITDEFMQALENNNYYSLVNPCTGTVVGKLKAKEVFNKISMQSWKTGDPGIIFIDRINLDNPTPNLGKIESVSGCGEQPLLPYEACILGSINLTKMLKNIHGILEIDYTKLSQTVTAAVNFLDNAIDVTTYPLSQVEEITKKTRKIGLGVMGFADMLIKIGIPYNSEEAIKFADNIMSFIRKETVRTSELLAKDRGAFPAFKGSKYDISGSCPLRNAACNTIAPTGTISLIAGCSHSIEPNYAMVFVRNILEGEHLLEINPCFAEIAKKENLYSQDLLLQIVAGNGWKDNRIIPDSISRLFVTTHEIEPELHVKMQGVFQRYVDNGVSKMINLPKDATKEDVANIFILAYKEGLKGAICYREGSRQLQSLSKTEEGIELVSNYFSEIRLANIQGDTDE